MHSNRISPFRAFHSLTLGLAAGALLGFALHLVQSPAPSPLADHSEPADDPPEAIAPATFDPARGFLNNPPGDPDTDTDSDPDTDRDGISDSWESQFGLNPNDPSDAASDFDLDGLTAFQEYELHTDTNGLYGNPLGAWQLDSLTPGGTNQPSGYVSISRMSLIEVASNGLLLIQVTGVRTDDPSSSSSPHVYHPQTRTWTRVMPPPGFPENTALTTTDINSRGDVVGRLPSGTTRGFLWTSDPVHPHGGSSQSFTLHPNSPSPTPAIPVRISDSGHFIYINSPDQQGTPASRAASPGRTPLSLVPPGDWSQPTLVDVNDYGEFVGVVYDPFSLSQKTFLVTDYGFFFVSSFTWSTIHNSEDWALRAVPEIDLESVDWIGIDQFVPNDPFFSYPDDSIAFAETTDLATGQTVILSRSYSDVVRWFEPPGLDDPEGGIRNWHALHGEAPPAHVNDWGEFSGVFTASIDQHSQWMDGESGGGSWDVWSEYRTGVFLFDGQYRLNPAAESVHALSNDPRMILGNGYEPTHLWSDGVSVPFTRFFPQGALGRAPGLARLADDGWIILQQGGAIHLIFPNDDADGDGMPDDWEINYSLDPNNPSDAFLISSPDGISNHGKFLLRADPNEPLATDEDDHQIDTRPGIDTDGDGMPNVWEWENGLDYKDALDAHLDYDRDGFTNLQEFRLGTDPRGAPAFTVHEPGPFTGVSAATLTASSANGFTSAVIAAGSDGSDHLWFHATPTPGPDQGSARPASWSTSWGFAFRKSEDIESKEIPHTQHVAAAPTGAALAITTSTPRTLYFWPSADASPIPLHGGHTAPTGQVAHNIHSLSDVSFSPSGNLLVARRTRASSGSDWILWDMQAAPRVLSGVTASTIATITGTLRVNDFGHVTGNGTVSGKSRALFWKYTSGTETLSPLVLPDLPGGATSNAVGLSNHSNPIVAGTANTLANGTLRNRATVWTVTTTSTLPTAIATDLGTLGSPLDSPPTAGSNSALTAISPTGWVAGHADLLVNGTIRYQAITANPVDDFADTPVLGTLTPHGPPSAKITVTAINNSGELLGTSRPDSASSTEIPTLWRRGKSHLLDQSLPPATGHTLISVTAINENGSLLATAWKDNTRTTLVLSQTKDTDGDGLTDKWENENRFNPYAPHPLNADGDGDQLTDLEEFRNGTDPHHPDTDRDGMHDGWEVSWGFLPLDPSDAHLDPDNDRVTNLREFQIGTTPTGIYKVEILATHPAYTYADLLAADDQGGIIHWGTEGFQEHEPAGAGVLNHYRYWKDVQYHPAHGSSAPFTELPRYEESQQSGDTWSINQGQWPTYWAGNGTVNGIITRYESTWDGTNSTWNQTHYLIPDALHPAALTPDTENNWFPWIPWETVESRLRDPNLHSGQLPLGAGESLEFQPAATSSDGTRRIHTIKNTRGRRLILDQEGQLIHILPTGRTWQFVNNAGTAIAAHYESVPGGSILEIHQASAASSPLPITVPISSGVANDYALKGFSDDGHVLLAQTLKNAQFATGTRRHLFNLRTGALTPVRQPGFGNESLTSLSNQNARLLGKGPKPFQITPDGTCIKLEALRIQNHPESEPTPLHPGVLNLHSDQTGTHFRHITSTGTITLTTSGPTQEQILQIIPHNDADGDGIPDDWERSLAAEMLAMQAAPEYWGDSLTSLLSGNLNPLATLQADGMTIQDLYSAAASKVNDDKLPRHHLFIQAKRSEFGFFVSHESITHDESRPTVNNGGGSFWEGSSGYDVGSIETWTRRPATIGHLDVQMDPFSVTPRPTLDWFNNEGKHAHWTYHTHWDQAADPSANSLFPIEDMPRSSVTFMITDGGSSDYYQFQKSGPVVFGASTTTTQWSGTLKKSKFRLYRPRPTKEPVSQTFLKVTTEHTYEMIGEHRFQVHWGASTTSVETITATVPAFGHTSQWIETSPEVVAQKHRSVALLPVELVPDWNRDGMITAADRGQMSEENPWRFWRNSDDDSGTEGGDDIPGADEPDYQGSSVDGVRDMVDFFPVHFDLKSVLEVLPETEYQYFLRHNSQSFYLGGALPVPSFNVLWYPEAGLEAEPSGESGVGSYLKNLPRAQDIAGRASNMIPQNGLQIPEEMLTAAKHGKGVALFESRQATDNPIMIEIRKKDGSSVAEIEMPVTIQEVESMFRSKFLKENLGGGTQGGVPSKPSNWPDSDRNGKHFIFVHGYNVSGEQARGWNSEMFKRMFWSGSDAMFTGVAWHGNESQLGTATPDYWRNVHNAFQTSKSVADFVNALPGSGKCIAAHSLGNIVVSSAIKDHGLSVANYYMVDAAAAIEAYSLASTLGNVQMSHPDWRVYDQKLWCSEWHKIFPESDNRRKMTWRGRFGDLPNAYNFHSTGEEVLKNGDGTIPGSIGVAASGGVRAWMKQEMSKGFSIGSGGGLLHNGTGGWAFNSHWNVVIYSPYGGGGSRRRNPAEAATIHLATLKENPFFYPFVNDKFHDPALGSAEAAKYNEVSKALAESLPSLTFAAGSNPIQIFNARNFDMMSLKNGWPKGRQVADGVLPGDWLHGDLRKMAFLFTYKVFGKFVELGDLNQ